MAGPTNAEEWDYFIVYSSEDVAPASLLHKMLAKHGSTFFDQTCVRPGDAFPAVLGSALDKSACAVVLVTPNWQDTSGRYYTAEYVRALDNVRYGKQRIVPILLGKDVAYPYGLEQYSALRVNEIQNLEHHMPL